MCAPPCIDTCRQQQQRSYQLEHKDSRSVSDDNNDEEDDENLSVSEVVEMKRKNTFCQRVKLRHANIVAELLTGIRNRKHGKY